MQMKLYACLIYAFFRFDFGMCEWKKLTILFIIYLDFSIQLKSSAKRNKWKIENNKVNKH